MRAVVGRSGQAAGARTRSSRCALVAHGGAAVAAFLEGHPFRIRYMVPLIAAEAVGAGVAAGLVPNGGCALPAAIAAGRCWRRTNCGRSTRQRRWSSKRSGIVRTCRCAQRVTDVHRAAAATATRSWRAWDRSATTCRKRRAAASRSAISCTKATATSGSRRSSEPRPFAGWMLIEEKAEGGDMLAQAARASTRNFSTVFGASARARGLALYRGRERSRPYRRTAQNLTLNVNR